MTKSDLRKEVLFALKQDFEDVVRENTGWLLAFVRQSVRNREIAEDLVQETFLKAYRRYDDYEESGKLRGWLKTIARNTLKNYYAAPEPLYVSLSLDAESTEDGVGSFLDLLPDSGPTPEEALLHRELVERVMQILASMPPPQRMVLTYRYIDGLTVEQTALRMGIPQGSVKSSAHYALQKMREELGVSSPKPQKHNVRKGEMIMKCAEVSRYLFQYALEKLPADVKADVAKHIETCPACRDIVTALRNLIPHLPKGRVGEVTHYNITFHSIDICYSNTGKNLENAELLNASLQRNGGRVPEGENWWGGGASKNFSLLGMFDAEGEEMEYVITDAPNPDNYHYQVRKLRKVYDPIHWERSVFEDRTDIFRPKQSHEAPNLYTGRVSMGLGADANGGIYVALPKEATNIRLRRGSGVIDCGTYQFVYVQRYLLESESLWLEYTYNQ